jgi:hypothetical protein
MDDNTVAVPEDSSAPEVVEGEGEESQKVPETAKPSTELWPVIEHIIQVLPIERWQAGLRLMKGGLFVSKNEADAVIAEYRIWFRKSVEHELSEEKAARKVFGEQRRLVYLQEGKRTLEGYIAACDISNPANFRKPFYLGSPTEASSALLPGDPALSMAGITVKAGPEQILEYRVAGALVPVNMRVLRSFRNLATWYGALKEKEREISESLRSAAVAFGGVLKDARDGDVKGALLRPMRLEKVKATLKQWKGLEIWIGPKFGVEALYAYAGRSLHGFLRDELSYGLGKIVKGRMGSFEFFNRKHKFVGAFQAHGKRHQLMGHAFQRYVLAFLDGDFPPTRKGDDVVWTVRTYLEELLSAIQLAKPIAPALVKDYLEDGAGDTVLCTERWLFVVTKGGVVKDAIARIAKNRRG